MVHAYSDLYPLEISSEKVCFLFFIYIMLSRGVNYLLGRKSVARIQEQRHILLAELDNRKCFSFATTTTQ